MNLLVGILSAESNIEKRRVCRETWVGLAASLDGVSCIFLLGGGRGPARLEGDCLYLPCEDRYELLHDRIRLFFSWACESTDAEHIFKCDDDTYVALDRLVRMVPDAPDYAGYDIGFVQGMRPYASGGAGYLLGRRAAIVAGRADIPPLAYEDVGTGESLRRHGITVKSDSRFVPFGELGGWPAPDNELISGHQPDDIETFYSIHSALYDGRDVRAELASDPPGGSGTAPTAPCSAETASGWLRLALIHAIRFYRRHLSRRGPLKNVLCTFHAHESCSAFAERIACTEPTTLAALRKITRRLGRCRDFSLYRLSDGTAAWGSAYDVALRLASPSAAARWIGERLAEEGENSDVQREARQAAYRVAVAAGTNGQPPSSFWVSLPTRRMCCVRASFARRFAASLGLALGTLALGALSFLTDSGWFGVTLGAFALTTSLPFLLYAAITSRALVGLFRIELERRL